MKRTIRMNRLYTDTLLWRRNPKYPNSYSGASVAVRLIGRRAIRLTWTRSGSAWKHGLDGASLPSYRNFVCGPIKFVDFYRIATHLTIGRLTITYLKGYSGFLSWY